MQNLISDDFRKEQKLIKISIALTTVMGLIGILIGTHIDSTAITIDGMYCSIGIFSTYLIFLASQKMNLHYSKKFQFGYYKLEPLVILGEGALIIGSCAFALTSAIRDIIHLHYVKNFLLPAFYQGIAACACFLMAFLFYRFARPRNNQLLLSQGLVWFIDGLQSIMLSIAFFLGVILNGTAYAFIIPYIDPVLVICLIFIIIREPIKLLKINSEELLDVMSDQQLGNKIDRIVYKHFKERNLDKFITKIFIRKAGRAIFVHIIILPEIMLPLTSLRQIKTELIEKLNQPCLYLFISI
ncbi:cation efflux protein [Legionella sainthelensi]|uniref:Cation efflux protein n=1 Tax=Legionella sainthelensi TaxID=28087 RepID=A0A0W0YNJ7_9GAMM|nr:cation transporter [Legionella sainthelensi]KTD58102.1 cation efflux protein [Legionella sainthelensi]VEH33866.1 cation efflux protein [Legionella sainthelensi]